MEGGMTDGMPIILRAAMKPIPTLRRPLRSIDIRDEKNLLKQRMNVLIYVAVPAAGVIGEAMVALTIADAFLEKFGGDSMKEIQNNYDSYVHHIKQF